MEYIRVICAVIECLCNLIKTCAKIRGWWIKKRTFADEESLHDGLFDASRSRHLYESGKKQNCLCYQTNTKEDDPGHHHTTCTHSGNDGKSI